MQEGWSRIRLAEFTEMKKGEGGREGGEHGECILQHLICRVPASERKRVTWISLADMVHEMRHSDKVPESEVA